MPNIQLSNDQLSNVRKALRSAIQRRRTHRSYFASDTPNYLAALSALPLPGNEDYFAGDTREFERALFTHPSGGWGVGIRDRRGRGVVLSEKNKKIQTLLDDTGIDKYDKWPDTIFDTIFRNEALSNQQRFKVSVFMLNNGLPPTMLKKLLLHFPMDAAANRQMKWIVDKWNKRPWAYTSWIIDREY